MSMNYEQYACKYSNQNYNTKYGLHYGTRNELQLKRSQKFHDASTGLFYSITEKSWWAAQPKTGIVEFWYSKQND